jgi:hypothetical protein
MIGGTGTAKREFFFEALDVHLGELEAYPVVEKNFEQHTEYR